MNVQLWLTGYFMLSLVEIVDIKYLNNIVEQSHRWVKQKTRQALGWKSMEGALASLHGREVWTMLNRIADPYHVKTSNAYPTTIRRQSRQLPQLPLNCGRHYLRRYLQINDVPQELIKLQMGHWVTGENPLEGFSSLCMTEAINDLLPTLDKMMNEIGWESTPSALTRKRQ